MKEKGFQIEKLEERIAPSALNGLEGLTTAADNAGDNGAGGRATATAAIAPDCPGGTLC